MAGVDEETMASLPLGPAAHECYEAGSWSMDLVTERMDIMLRLKYAATRDVCGFEEVTGSGTFSPKLSSLKRVRWST